VGAGILPQPIAGHAEILSFSLAVAIDLIVQHIREVYASNTREMNDNSRRSMHAPLDKTQHTPSMRPH
jgi:hypothetical protein